MIGTLRVLGLIVLGIVLPLTATAGTAEALAELLEDVVEGPPPIGLVPPPPPPSATDAEWIASATAVRKAVDAAEPAPGTAAVPPYQEDRDAFRADVERAVAGDRAAAVRVWSTKWDSTCGTGMDREYLPARYDVMLMEAVRRKRWLEAVNLALVRVDPRSPETSPERVRFIDWTGVGHARVLAGKDGAQDRPDGTWELALDGSPEAIEWILRMGRWTDSRDYWASRLVPLGRDGARSLTDREVRQLAALIEPTIRPDTHRRRLESIEQVLAGVEHPTTTALLQRVVALEREPASSWATEALTERGVPVDRPALQGMDLTVAIDGEPVQAELRVRCGRSVTPVLEDELVPDASGTVRVDPDHLNHEQTNVVDVRVHRWHPGLPWFRATLDPVPGGAQTLSIDTGAIAFAGSDSSIDSWLLRFQTGYKRYEMAGRIPSAPSGRVEAIQAGSYEIWLSRGRDIEKLQIEVRPGQTTTVDLVP